MDYLPNHLNGPHTFPKWDKAKRLMHTHAKEALGQMNPNVGQTEQGFPSQT
jgi:hypothetical protein